LNGGYSTSDPFLEEFRRDVKKLHKKYRSIKKDILDAKRDYRHEAIGTYFEAIAEFRLV
jgi:hypothetical protein